MKWFSRRQLGTKLIMGFFIITLVAGVVGAVGVFNILKIESLYSEMHEKATVPLGQMVRLVDSFQRMRSNIKDVLMSTSQQEIQQYERLITVRSEEFDSSLALIEETLMTEEGRLLTGKIREDKMRFDTVNLKIIALMKDNRPSEAQGLNQSDSEMLRQSLEMKIQELSNMKVNIADATASANAATAKAATVAMLTLLGAGVLLSGLIGTIIYFSVRNSIYSIVQAAQKIADGDLDVELEVYTKDGLGRLVQSFNDMAHNINEIMTQIHEAADQVASGSGQVSDSSMSLSQGATEQASSIEQLTASIEEIATQTRLNAQNANQANELADKTQQKASQGNLHMQQMLRSMEEINVSSASISKIIKVIDEIAFQTNILALNAAVEAARAGQHGKGFAVVAEEVRNLAARSANAAKETTALIEGSMQKVEGGTRIANETAAALKEIVESIQRVSGLVSDIAAASNDQAVGVDQVNQGISQIASVVQTTSATSEETAAASEELSSQAEMLKQQVAKFKLKQNVKYSHLKDSLAFEPNALHVIETMKIQNRQALEARTENFSEAPKTKKIVLSEKEFGKYTS
jgi:methyl-accepting chemotaxis protein